MKYAKSDGSTWFVETVDSVSDVGYCSSLALDSNGKPHISYVVETFLAPMLKYAHWNDSSWDTGYVDQWAAAFPTSLALDSSDNPHISYSGAGWEGAEWGELKYIYWNGSSWGDTQILDLEGNVCSSLALDSSDNPHISYSEGSDLKYTYFVSRGIFQEYWSNETVDSEGDVGGYTSLALDSNYLPHISYYDQSSLDLKYAKWNGTSWSKVTVDSEGDVGQYSSLALDSSDNPHISYYDATNNCLKYAKWNGTSWSKVTVDSEGDVGQYSSLALDSSDNPHISYYDRSKLDLKYSFLPELSVSVSPDSRSVVVGESTSFSANASGGISPYWYQWYENGNSMAGQTSTQLTVSKSTAGTYEYHCRVKDSLEEFADSNIAALTVNTESTPTPEPTPTPTPTSKPTPSSSFPIEESIAIGSAVATAIVAIIIFKILKKPKKPPALARYPKSS